MSGQTTPNQETSPLLGNQRTESYQTLVAHGGTPKGDDKEPPRASIAWVLAGLWSAVFLGALDGASLHRFL